MDDYLGNLLARQLDRLESVEPLLPSRFEPPAAAKLPPGARGFVGAEDASAPETRFGFGLETTEAYAPSPDTFPHATTSQQTRPAAPLRHDLQPPGHHARATTPRAPSTFEPSALETPTASEPPRARPESRPAHAADSPSPAPPTPARFEPPAHVGRLVPDDAAEPESPQPPRPAPRAFAQSERGADSLAADVATPAGPSPVRRETNEARAGSASSPPPLPPRETLLVPVLEPPGAPRRAAQPPPPSAGPQQSSPRAGEDARARADESEREAAEIETARRSLVRREKPKDERPAVQREPPPTVFVQPRLTQRADPHAPQQADALPMPEPTINVTIGRIEIRATNAAAPRPAPARREAPGAQQPMSLEDYLRRRGGGGGR